MVISAKSAIGAMTRSPLARSRRFARSAGPVGRPRLERLGSDYGGWTIPTDLVDRDSIVYSGGVGTDITFDLALIERYGCTVFAFDPTPSSVVHVNECAAGEDRFRFFPWGLWSEDGELRFYAPDYGDSNFSAINLHRQDDYFVAPGRTLTSSMYELGHERIDLLKLDIEGAEYRVLRSLLADEIPVRVLCVEFHKTPSIRQMKRSVRELRSGGFTPVHLNGFDMTLVCDNAAARAR